ncbi:phage minor capsid protein [Streptomyces sp. NPDC057555]|uniref:phage minor capsid protein n=1 Tax=Streptomyces sp. NPDC057555 TaxID=3346166 RepID=UPI0036C8C958
MSLLWPDNLQARFKNHCRITESPRKLMDQSLHSESTGAPLLRVETRRQATQAAMERFADRGFRTFIDRFGRAWSMTSYAEMAVRTALGRAAVEAYGDRLRAAACPSRRFPTHPIAK